MGHDMFVRPFSKRLAQDLEYMADEVVPWCGFAEIAGFARLRPRTRGYAGYCWTEGELHLLLRMEASPLSLLYASGLSKIKASTSLSSSFPPESLCCIVLSI
jgi:hypothetical protein